MLQHDFRMSTKIVADKFEAARKSRWEAKNIVLRCFKCLLTSVGAASSLVRLVTIAVDGTRYGAEYGKKIFD